LGITGDRGTGEKARERKSSRKVREESLGLTQEGGLILYEREKKLRLVGSIQSSFGGCGNLKDNKPQTRKTKMPQPKKRGENSSVSGAEGVDLMQAEESLIVPRGKRANERRGEKEGGATLPVCMKRAAREFSRMETN